MENLLFRSADWMLDHPQYIIDMLIIGGAAGILGVILTAIGKMREQRR